ncbi:hypothetical protein ILUMI_14647 [Ignelater luminosus]|uniref:CIDE-N domain-containing protein n=1 Tax=Ignelater luminosus TaxID=2038154 RepID=A0A8K0GAA1_IGNLU|nr:hypothetical protein ILUMI_14647 [Ignelater luminosus]
MSLLFKVWNITRQKKVFVVLNSDDQQLYVNLVLKASEKLELDGSTLVLESDGTIIDDDHVLRHLEKETLILLEKDQKWICATSGLNLSTCSTETK